MKGKKRTIILIIAAIVIIAIIAIFFVINSIVKKPFKTNDTINLTIKSGESFDGVLTDLSDKHLIANKDIIKLYTKITNSTPKITPGIYQISADSTLSEFVQILNDHKPVTVVIPEGYNIDQIAATLQKDELCSSQDFIAAVKAYPLPSFIKPVEGRRYQLEGYLFPNTYEFNKGETPDQIIKTMLDAFNTALNKAMKTTGVKVTEDQISDLITKASVIQGEGNTPANMKLVSSVINNRIAQNMPLQMDATIIYAMGVHVNKVYDKDLKIKSPYNTYLNKGLPIGPICNPGIEAIEAALKPANTNDLYYILNGSTQYFTNSYADFQKEEVKFNSSSK